MAYFKILLVLFLVKYVFCKENEERVYRGEKFPIKYLSSDGVEPTYKDFKHYLTSLDLTMTYFQNRRNRTGCNEALGTYFCKMLLKRCLLDYKDRMQEEDVKLMKSVANKAEDVLSHYSIFHKYKGWNDVEYRVAELFREDVPFIHSIENFKKGLLAKWILADGSEINDHIEEMDEARFSKEEYFKTVEYMDDYYINIDESDMCLSKVIYNRIVLDHTKLVPCKEDKYCDKAVHSSPSISYSLSHRYINLMMRRFMRRCYMRGAEYDMQHIEQLCAFMYREAVYLARRGYFLRDIFLEHIALCGMMGYEEFFRHNWFRKAISWMNDIGCIQEDRNGEIRRADVFVALEHKTLSRKNITSIKRGLKKALANECHLHQMSLLVIVLAHAIRHALHFMKTPVNKVIGIGKKAVEEVVWGQRRKRRLRL